MIPISRRWRPWRRTPRRFQSRIGSICISRSAKAYEDIGRPESAFRQLLTGNGLKRRQIAYDEAAMLAAWIASRECSAATSSGPPRLRRAIAVPIFIVGMPRSGTTLIEQILASHPRGFWRGRAPLVRPGRRCNPQCVAGRPVISRNGVGACRASIFVPWVRNISTGWCSGRPEQRDITDKMP